MSIKDYAHWNEDARFVWWQEEGRFENESEFDPLEEERAFFAAELAEESEWETPHTMEGQG